MKKPRIAHKLALPLAITEKQKNKYYCKVNINMKKQILKTLTFTLFSTLFLACSFKPIDVYFEYPILQASEQADTDSVRTKSEKIDIIFADGFQADNVKMVLNKNMIFNKKILERIPICDSFQFNREKVNKIQLFINGRKSNIFVFNEKYDIGIITYHKKENKIIFRYDFTDKMIGVD